MWAKKPHSQTSTEINLIMSRAEWEVGMVQNGWNCVFLLYLYFVFLEWRMLQTGGSCRLSSARRLAECSAIATDSWTASEWTHRQVALLNSPPPDSICAKIIFLSPSLCQKKLFTFSPLCQNSLGSLQHQPSQIASCNCLQCQSNEECMKMT